MTHIYKSALILLCAALLLPAPARAQDITTGLQGYWTLDETSGTNAADASGNGNAGTLDADAAFSAGRIGNGILLDGTGDSVNIANESFFDYPRTQAFTISAWVFRESNVSEDDIVEKYDGAAVRGYALFLPSSENTVELSLDDGGGSIRVKGGNINTNQWHHVAATYNGSSNVSGLKIYIDGVLQSATPTGTTISGNILNNLQLTIGEEAPTSTCCGFDGRIDEVRIYNRELSANDILYLYDGTKGGKIRYNTQNRATEYFDSDMWIPMGRQTYSPNAVAFDGTDYIDGFPTAADSGQLSGSFWFRRTGSGNMDFLGKTGDAFEILIYSDTLDIIAENNAGTEILEVHSPVSITDSNWHHVMFSFDLTDTNRRHLYIDGVSGLNVVDYTNDTMNFGPGGGGHEWSVGANTGGSDNFVGDIADFWINTGTYIDLSDPENRKKFYDNGPVYLGEDGEKPTGSAPEVFLSGNTDTWHTNDGTGGGFTENGILNDAALQPAAAPSAIIQSVNGYEYSMAGDTQMSFPVAPGAGNTVIVGVSTYVGCGALPGASATVTDNRGNTYDQVVLGDDGGENIRSYIFAADNISTGSPFTLTFTHNAGSTFCVTAFWSAIEVDGIATIDQTGTAASNSDSTVTVSTSGQTASSPQIAVAMLGLNTSDPDDNTLITHEDGWIEQGVANTAFGGELVTRHLSGAGGAPSHTWTWGGWDIGASASIATFTYTPINNCANPARTEGTIIYNTTSDQMQFCNGEDWIAMGPPGNGGGGCSNPAGGEGEMVFNSSGNVMQYCEGSDWIKVGLRSAPENGLLYHWRLDETSGTVADDSVGANNGTLTAGLDAGSNSAAGKYGNGLDFDGTDDYISTPSITIPASGTIALWLKADTPGGGTTTRIWGNHDNFEMNLGTSSLFVGDICGNSIFNSVATAVAGQWYHVVMTWNDAANETILYLDGQEEVTSTSSITCGQSGNFLIGNRPAAGAGQQFDGVLDDVRYYNRILNPGEVYNLYRATGGN